MEIVRRMAAWLFVLFVGTGAAALFTSDDLTERYVPLLVVLCSISGICWLSLTVTKQYRLRIVRVDSQELTTHDGRVRASAPTNDPAGLPAVLERHRTKGELLAEGLRSAASILEKRRLEAEVDAWERAAYADLARFADVRPFRGSREIAGDMTPPLVFRPSNVRDLESHLHEEPEGLRPGSDPVIAFLDTKLWWLKAMIGPAEDADPRQARDVVIWPSDSTTSKDGPVRRYQQIRLRNGSDAIIRDVRVSLDTGALIEDLIVVAPGEEHAWELSNTHQVEVGRDPGLLKVEFTDTFGQRWELDGRGNLQPRVS